MSEENIATFGGIAFDRVMRNEVHAPASAIGVCAPKYVFAWATWAIWSMTFQVPWNSSAMTAFWQMDRANCASTALVSCLTVAQVFAVHGTNFCKAFTCT